MAPCYYRRMAPREVDTERLCLRPFSLADGEAHERLYADPEVTRWLGDGPWLGAAARERSARTVARFVDHWAREGFGVWAVIERATGAFLGQCGLNRLEDGEIEVLYALAQPAWGRGLASEAATAAVRYGFDVVGLSRIVAVARPDNTGSRRVMEKAGLVYERDTVFRNIPAVLYGIGRPA